MATLEQEGYLLQPHTSAGRVPTEKGYRFFVDALDGSAALDGRRREAGPQRSSPRPTASSSRCWPTPAGCCRASPTTPPWSSAPPHEAATVRSVQLVGLAPRVALLVVVLSNGVDREAHPRAGSRGRRRRAGRRQRAPDHGLTGLDPRGLRRCPLLDRPAADRRRRRRRPGRGGRATRPPSATASPIADQVYVGGTSRMAVGLRRGRDRARGAADPRAAVRRRHPAARRARPRPARGHRHRDRHGAARRLLGRGRRPTRSRASRPAPSACSGPTRMNYPQALAAVAVVSQRLGRRLTRGLMRRVDRLLRAARVSPDRHRRRDQAGLPAAGPRAAPRRQPRRPGGRGAVQGGGAWPTRR